MKIKEWQEFHGFTDEDVSRIDDVKKIFGGKIEIIRTRDELDEHYKDISKQNKINIDRLWIK